MKKLFQRFLATVFAAAALAAGAGGPLSVCPTGSSAPYSPLKYPGAGNVTFNYDLGNLGSRTNAQAAAIVNAALATWTNVTTATVTLARGSNLPVDVTTANYATYLGNSTFGDGINPVVYDTDGSITDLMLGVGANANVLGFAGSAYGYSPCQYVEGRAVINGKIGVSDATMTTVLTHELGHFIGLDHTQLDGAQGLATANYPLMYPIAYRTNAGLHEDDVAAITALYPDATVNSTYGTLTGTFVTAGGVPVGGANIWAQNTTTGALFSVVSDTMAQGNGSFRLLLTPGTYTLHAEAIATEFTGGSGVGPYSNDLSDASFQPPLYSGANGSGTALAVNMTSQFTMTAGCNASLTFRIDGSSVTGASCATPSAMTSPANGSTLAGSSVTFTWNAGTGGTITERLLMVGTTLGGSDVYSGYQGSGLSRLVTGIPTNGATIYVRLMSYMGGAWVTRDYTYTAATITTPTPSAITTPPPGSTLPGATVTFGWTAGNMVTARTVSIGSTLGGSQYYGPTSQGTALSLTVSNMPTNGSTVYVRLTQTVNGVSQSTDYTYTSVLLATASAITSPTPGTVLGGSSATFQWSAGVGVTERYFSVGTTAGGSDIYGGYQGAGLSRAVTGIPTDGRTIFVRLSSWVGSGWSTANYTYTASGSGAPPPCTVSAMSALNSPSAGSTLAGSSATFGWSAGCNVTERYLSVGSTAGASDIYGGYQGAGLSRAVSGIPTDGRTIYVTLSSWVGSGWLASSATYTAFGTGSVPKTPTRSMLTSPASGSTLPGASVTFQWDAGSGVTERFLAIGSSAGASDIFGAYKGASLSQTVNTMPTDGRTIYVTLSSWLGSGWQTSTATYTAATTAGPPPASPSSVITSPAPGSTLGTSATFQWTAGTGVTERYFMVGTTLGGTEIYGGYQGAGLSRAVSGLPTGSRTVYVRLMSYIGGTWVINTSPYTSAP
jgi:hypothetical protein